MTGAAPDDRIIDAALALAAERGWRGFALADVAGAAGLPLGEVAERYPGKGAILAGLTRRADRAVLAGFSPEDRGEPARDRVLDALMRRFDALRPWRAGLRAARRDPAVALCAAPALLRSMAAMLEAAGIAGDGPRGRARAAGLAVIYMSAFRVWLEDDSDDSGATTAHLARALARADRFAGLCRRRRAASQAPEEEPNAA